MTDLQMFAFVYLPLGIAALAAIGAWAAGRFFR
jgi:hypothetical protein